MNQDKLLQIHDMLCAEARAIMKVKNDDYGAERDLFLNFRMVEAMGLAPTEIGILIRIADKISRLRSFFERGELSVEDEGPRDACLDILNYVILLWALQVEKGTPHGDRRE